MPVSEIVVRRAHRGDLARLLELYVSLGADGASAPQPADPTTAEAILAEVSDDPARELVVAEVDGQVCGTADLLIAANMTHGGAPWAIIENVVVAPECRRRGVGSAIMRHLVSVARERGCYKAQLLSGRQRSGAHTLYRSLGFEAVAEGFKLYLDG